MSFIAFVFISSNSDAPSVKEKADYAECTSMAFKKYKFDFLLVIQDDVVAKENALTNIIQVIIFKFSPVILRFAFPRNTPSPPIWA